MKMKENVRNLLGRIPNQCFLMERVPFMVLKQCKVHDLMCARECSEAILPRDSAISEIFFLFCS